MWPVLFKIGNFKIGTFGLLVEGNGGGVSTALIMLGRQAGFRVWVTSRDEAKRARAVQLGAHEAFASGTRLPEKVDAVMETVGAATWSHSLRALKPGGVIVIAGATSVVAPPADRRAGASSSSCPWWARPWGPVTSSNGSWPCVPRPACDR